MSKEKDLETALVDEITSIFENDTFYNEAGTLTAINSYKHSLPNAYYDEEINYAPYIISEANSTTEDTENCEIQVVFTICVCDGIISGEETLNQDRHCEDDLFHIKDKIIERFKKNSLIDDRFICENSWQFAIVDDNTSPLYYAGLTAKFKTAKAENEIGYNNSLI